jgi:hypothetical protein
MMNFPKKKTRAVEIHHCTGFLWFDFIKVTLISQALKERSKNGTKR